MTNMEEKEIQRIQQIIDKMEQEYPKNMQTEAFIQDTFVRISNMDKAIIKSSFQICKSETDELNKYANFNGQMALEMKENIDERKFEESLKKWQSCLQLKHQDFAQTLHTMDREFYDNNNKMNKCVDDCAANSTSKSDQDMEKCIRTCMLNHESVFNEITKKYNSTFKDYENKYKQYI